MDDDVVVLRPSVFLLKSNHLLTIFIIFFPKSMGPPSLAHIMLAKHGRHAAKGEGGRRGRRREEGEEGRGRKGRTSGSKEWMFLTCAIPRQGITQVRGGGG